MTPYRTDRAIFRTHGRNTGYPDPSGVSVRAAVAHQVATEQIFVACQVESTLISRDVGDVGHPDLIWGGRLELAFLFAAYPQFPANALDAVNAGIDAVFS